jgi:succinyl-diaminopimelate desuccinylase
MASVSALSIKTSVRTIDRWIDTHRDDLVDLTCQLVNIDTTVPPGRNYDKIARVLASELKELGSTPTISYIPQATFKERANVEVGLEGPRPNVFATIKGKDKGPRIVLNGHIDVVPAQQEGWKTNPFKATVNSGKIYGRGAADMKGSDACLLYAIKALIETGMPFNGSITLTYTTDEEVGGYTGVNYLVDKHVITKDIDYGLSTDTGIEAIDVASLGDIEFVITVHGVSAHSGRGWTGINAIEHASALIERFKKLGAEIGRKRSKVRTEPVYGSRWMRPGVYVTMIKGGIKGNIIPDTCELLVDRRFIPEENPETVKREIAEVVRGYSRETGVRITNKPLPGYNPMMTPPDHPLVKVVKKAAKRVLGENVPVGGSQGSTDMATVSALGIPVVILGATRSESNIHGINEHVRIDDLVSITKIMAQSYLELLSVRQ